jgi:hypothetical protein
MRIQFPDLSSDWLVEIVDETGGEAIGGAANLPTGARGRQRPMALSPFCFSGICYAAWSPTG